MGILSSLFGSSDDKPYSEKTEKSHPMGPLPVSNNSKTTVTDNKTGDKYTGYGKNEKESRDAAWKDKRERNGG